MREVRRGRTCDPRFPAQAPVTDQLRGFVQLIGMLDSPYVRRVAVSFQLLGLPFEHQSVSVFRTFEQFRRINPVVKAPSLVCDDGTVLMDSTLILEDAENLAAPRKSLMPAGTSERRQALRVIGLASPRARKAYRSSTSATCGRLKSCISHGSPGSRVSSWPLTTRSSPRFCANLWP